MDDNIYALLLYENKKNHFIGVIINYISGRDDHHQMLYEKTPASMELENFFLIF